uniref:Uncharacterized protein n=1 Tax=Sphaerodactylus townsendi TaxID=933632 RepID=A0ACB8FYF1_9SAUR
MAQFLIAVQVLARENGLPNPTADSSSHPGTTAGPSIFRKFLNEVKRLASPVWHDASTTVSATAPGFPSAHTPARVPFVEEPLLKGVAPVNFSLRVLKEDLSVAEEPGVYVEGSAVHIEARLLTAPGMLFPKIFIDECYGTDTKQQIHPRRLYVIADNHGCLYSPESDAVASWFRKEDSVIVFTVPTFLVTGKPEEEIYIHCLLTAWSQKTPTSPGKKACYFHRVSSSWKNIDEPSKTSVCNCCDSFCPMESPRLGNFKGEGKLHREVVGPLIVRKEDIPWFEGQCHTIKNLLLVSVAFVVSCVVAALFLGALLALALSLFHYSRTRKGHRLLKNKKEQPFDTELKTVIGALAVAEETEESDLDYCKLKGESPEKD